MISSSEITVVVQGPVVRRKPEGATDSATTAEVLESIRSNLPGVEIILSTWVDQETDGLDFDRLVRSEDPGSVGDRASSSSANVHRQIVSTANGLARAERKFVLKLRSDTCLTSSRFLEIWSGHSAGFTKPRCFRSRVLVSAIFSPCPRYCPSPYWVSDFFAFGLLEDVRFLWDIPMAEFDRMMEADRRRSEIIAAGKPVPPPVNAEQKLILAMATKAGVREKLESITSVDPFCLMRSERFIASHFLPVDPADSGFVLPERFHSFKGHHTYRFDHEGPLFRTGNSLLMRVARVRNTGWILFACVKGVGGRIHRRLRRRSPVK